jgi:uncharacterized protein (TIGR01777 family)
LNKTILITGATGFIGGYLIRALTARGDNTISLTTHPGHAKNKLQNGIRIAALDDYLSLKDEKIDAIINLAGRNLSDKRWNEKFKQEGYDSRIKTTAKVVDLISKMKAKPQVLISASGVDYYGDTGDKDVYEDSPHANNFMGNLCRDWEAEALKAEGYGVRTVVLRTGFVMAADAVAVKKLSMPFKFFVGGPVGSGKQYVSWIHIDDIVGIYLYALDNQNIKGAANATAPNPEIMKEFCKHMAEAMHRPSIFPVPAFAVKIAVGEMAEVVLYGRKALPEKIMALGFKFKYEHAIDAWKEVFI